MKTGKMCICNAQIVLPDKVIYGDIIIEAGLISAICAGGGSGGACAGNEHVIDAAGMYVLPGLIDIHSDAIEKEVQPRPNTLFPLDMSFHELEKKFAGNGVTRVYHSVSMGEGEGVRNTKTVSGIIDFLAGQRKQPSMIHHGLHLRYEVTNLEGVDDLERLVSSGTIDYLSFMDHSPGQTQFQFKDPGLYDKYLTKTYGIRGQELEEMVQKVTRAQQLVDHQRLQSIGKLARSKGIPVSSHDDNTLERVDHMLEYGMTISEFPLNLETARYAKEKDLHVCMGSPNVVRGKSHSNNMRAIDSIRAGSCNILCSDYHSSTLLPSVYKLVEEGISLAQAVSLVTINPARAMGISDQTGSLEAGKRADLVLVELHQGHPLVRKTLVAGNVVYQTDFNNETRFLEEVI